MNDMEKYKRDVESLSVHILEQIMNDERVQTDVHALTLNLLDWTQEEYIKFTDEEEAEHELYYSTAGNVYNKVTSLAMSMFLV